VLALAAVGELVPQPDFAGTVHSVFAQACYIECGELLLTLAAGHCGDGPATLRLALAATADLRALFEASEPVRCTRGIFGSRRAAFRIRGVALWRPDPPRALLPAVQVRGNLDQARARLGRREPARWSVLDREGAAVVAQAAAASRALDAASMRGAVDRLAGWGEGLTPAGDDFLAGWLFALQRLARNESQRRFAGELAARVAAAAGRTAPIAAAALRLAASGHHAAIVHALGDALLGESDDQHLARLLDRALAFGATSGADQTRGLLAGIGAWASGREPR
jgi:hypothetical protein